LKTYGNQSSLVKCPIDESLVFFGADGSLNKASADDTGKLTISTVFTLQGDKFSIPPSIRFATCLETHLALICDGKRLIICRLNSEGREWEEVKISGGAEGDGVLETAALEAVVMDACVFFEEEGKESTLHVLLQRVKKAESDGQNGDALNGETNGHHSKKDDHSSAFCSELTWLLLRLEGCSVGIGGDTPLNASLVSHLRFESASSADFGAISRDGQFLSVASQHSFSLVHPKVEEGPKVDELSKPLFAWSQTHEDVSIAFHVPETITKADIVFSLAGQTIKIGTKDGDWLLNGELHGPIDRDGCAWTLGKSILEVTLAKNQLCPWDRVVEGDDTPETVDTPLDAAALESLKHLTTDSWAADPDKPAKPFNTQELEECDVGGDETATMAVFDRKTLAFVHVTSTAANQVLFVAPSTSNEECPALCLRHDVDGLVWQPSPTESARPFRHVAALHAFGYVAASKTRRRFLAAAADFSFAVIADVDRHVYVYRQENAISGSSDLRNRKSGKRVASVATQQVFSLGNANEILGVVTDHKNIFILTQKELIKVAVNV